MMGPDLMQKKTDAYSSDYAAYQGEDCRCDESSPIDIELNSLMVSFSELEEGLLELSSRLSPVKVHVPSLSNSDKEECEVRDTASDLRIALSSFKERVDMLTHRVRDELNMIEL